MDWVGFPYFFSTFIKNTTMKKLFSLFLFPLLLVACSSDEDNDCTFYDYAIIDNIEQETLTVRVRQDLPITFDITIPNSCGEYKRLNVDKNGFVWQIDAVAFFEGCDCDDVSYTVPYPGNFIFRAEEIGTYSLRFNNYEGQMIQKNIVVTQ